jgi:hypothetical protein
MEIIVPREAEASADAVGWRSRLQRGRESHYGGGGWETPSKKRTDMLEERPKLGTPFIH